MFNKLSRNAKQGVVIGTVLAIQFTLLGLINTGVIG